MEVKANQEFSIRLNDAPSLGASWKLTYQSNNSALKFIKKEFVREPQKKALLLGENYQFQFQ